MGSSKRPHVFTPLDLEIIDLVYEAAWAQIIARDPFRNFTNDPDRKALLRKKIFAVAHPGPVDFDALLDKVLWISPEMWVAHTKPSSVFFTKRSGAREVSA